MPACISGAAPQLSPDGKAVAYLLSHADWKSGRLIFQIWRQDIGGGKTRMSIENGFPTVEAMEQLLAMGQEEGMVQAIGQIEAMLAEDGGTTGILRHVVKQSAAAPATLS